MAENTPDASRPRLTHLYVEPFGDKWVVCDESHVRLATCDTKEEARAWVNAKFGGDRG